jgi:hypothetical protein
MKLFDEWWSEYRSKIVPANASPSMVAESRKAFLAGIGCMFSAIITEMEKPGKAGQNLLDAVAEEITAFYNEELSQGND